MPTISDRQKEIIIDTWGHLTILGHSAKLKLVLSFYTNLFENAPEVQHYFSKDMNAQAEKLTRTFDYLINYLASEDELTSKLQELGRYHKYEIGVESSYYPIVIKSILFALKQTLGEKYEEEIGIAWKTMLVWVSRIMITAPNKKDNLINSFFKKLFLK